MIVNLRYEDYENSISYFGVDVFSVMAVLCSAGRTAVEDRLTGFCGTANEETADWLNFCLPIREVLSLSEAMIGIFILISDFFLKLKMFLL